jgi:hypothetical protein
MAKRKPFKSSRGKSFGTVERVFDDVWWAWGTTRFGPGVTFPRNMTLVRADDGLVALQPVMMPDAEQAKIDALGKVTHVVRLGDFHGMDNQRYLDRYDAKHWSPKDATPLDGTRVDHELAPGGALPLPDATLYAFDVAPFPEMVIHLRRHGGILLTCDSVQSWTPLPAGISTLGGVMARVMGFKGRACIGPGWRKQCEKGVSFGPKFRELLDLDFRHIIGAHGPPILDDAKDSLRAAVDAIYSKA